MTDKTPRTERGRKTLRRVLEAAALEFGERGYREYDQLYTFFVDLIETGKLGGGRFSGSA